MKRKIHFLNLLLLISLIGIIFGISFYYIYFLNDRVLAVKNELQVSSFDQKAGNQLSTRPNPRTPDHEIIERLSEGRSIPDENNYFYFENRRLTIRTQRVVLTFHEGAITFLKDNNLDEIYVETDVSEKRPLGNKTFMGFISRGSRSYNLPRAPRQYSLVQFSKINRYHGRLIYSFLYERDKSSGSSLIIDFVIDQESGEIIIQLTGIEGNPKYRPFSLDIFISNIICRAVILASGAKYSRGDAEVTDQTTYQDYGLYSPSMVVVEGKKGVMAAWSETTQFSAEYIRLVHKSDYDHLILHVEQDPKQTTPQRIVSPPWRIGIYSSWVKAAKRWREKFEDRTGATPLWKNRTPWVRRIHAVFYALSQFYGANEIKYAELACKAPPEKVLYFIWNGDRIVLFGDHTLIDGITRPTPREIEIIKKYGWHLLLYHPYNLIYSKKGNPERLDDLAKKGWLPRGYQFTPDFEGTAQNWEPYWADIRGNYYDGSKFFILHPGSSNFKKYLAYNFNAYCILHRADGAYLDNSGANLNFLFREREKVIEGEDYVMGEYKTLRKVARELPSLGLMSEFQSPWILPYVFYSWQGSVTHIRQNPLAKTRINHPLRAGLTGSYSWMRESNNENIDDVAAALLGTLPEISLVGDYNIDSDRARWSQARARLFCEQELFNDLPDKWDEDALAYYRSKGANWFKFKYLGSTYGYVEVFPNGDEVIRLSKQDSKLGRDRF